ncbi:ribonuclease P 40kDa subunit-domain-containing protein [Pyronema omphalodes]|nr:ribonuclease P 40kDa subunit-domain-containing protein [Pyronema omphalodes]
MPPPSPKCYLTLSSPGTSSPPFTNPFNHTLDLLLPSELYTLLSSTLLSIPLPSYSRLSMPLGRILEPAFFNHHIKSGNILLLSRGKLDAENLFMISEGILRMSLDTETYERAGLVGKPARYANSTGAGKRRRWLVEVDMRKPGFLTGSKGFERLKRACDVCFKEERLWLFADIAEGEKKGAEASVAPIPLSSVRQITRTVTTLGQLNIPTFTPPPNAIPHGGGKSQEAIYHREVWRDWAIETYEYLSLLSLPSDTAADRIKADDKVDSFLSSYAVEDATRGEVTRVRFRGFMGAKWVNHVLGRLREGLSGLQATQGNWVGMSVLGFDNVLVDERGKERGGLEAVGKAWTVLRLPGNGGELVWDIRGGQSE